MGRPVVAPYRQIGLTAQASIRATCALVDETNHQLDKRVLTGLMRGYFHPCKESELRAESGHSGHYFERPLSARSCHR